MKRIPYGCQDISHDDIQAVIEILQSDWLTQGPAIKRFEAAVAQYSGAKYGVAVNSATSALHIACLAADLGPGDLLWTSPNTFVASANCGLYCGAEVDFVDIDPTTYNMSITALAAKLMEAEKTGKLPKVVIPVHFAGQSCQMEELRKLADKYNFTVIEDAAHAIGGSYQGKKIGAGEYSEMAVFSFHPVKIITTGEGGMVLTNNEDLYERLMRLRTHGIARDARFMEKPMDGAWHYQQIELGYNYRMTDIQAALGYSQLQRIDGFVQRRHYLAARYDQMLKDLPVTLPWQDPDTYSAYHLYVLRLHLDELTKTRRQIFDELRAINMIVNVHYIPVHTQPYFERLGFKAGDFPEAEQYYRETLTIPLYYRLTDEDQEYVVDALRNIVK
ncbi:MAG TPA: UDP-4-amino-4,6-dideoxy-N-acetyl-beta-L-altrosamine transaminase [Firmicutes bacterium]|jgi:UDP-4-amino-4,6-dideoxy-N-acetyl-beta-L-altrosamine transaminase|nr:UDP-4-amino-4,6-dideoxy-N-acetyl-beta-L-altrosamine transaminase [Bacillota bacterium]